MDQGIIQNTKIHYRRRVIDRKLDAIEYDYEYVEIDIKSFLLKNTSKFFEKI